MDFYEEDCIVCGGEMPEDRRLTCSHDCYIQWRAGNRNAGAVGGRRKPSMPKMPWDEQEN